MIGRNDWERTIRKERWGRDNEEKGRGVFICVVRASGEWWTKCLHQGFKSNAAVAGLGSCVDNALCTLTDILNHNVVLLVNGTYNCACDSYIFS